MDIEFKAFQGRAIESEFDAIAALRITVFKAYPYLYEGDFAYEREYLKTYSNAENALMFGAFYRNSLVGATTCIPLEDETEDVQKPFLEAGMRLSEIFYFGESILLPEFRGLSIGNKFFDVREAHAASFGNFRSTCFCAVQRVDNHPLRPEGYQPLDGFWTKRGYHKVPELISHFDWLDVGQSESTAKPMVYWMRNL